MMSTYTPTEFKTMFSEFADTSVYSDSTIQMWMDYSVKQVNSQMWGTLAKMGVMLLTAHQLCLFNSLQTSGIVNGTQNGVVTSKSVKGVSVSYDVNTNLMEGAGQFNSTKYGLLYYQMLMSFPAILYSGY